MIKDHLKKVCSFKDQVANPGPIFFLTLLRSTSSAMGGPRTVASLI